MVDMNFQNNLKNQESLRISYSNDCISTFLIYSNTCGAQINSHYILFSINSSFYLFNQHRFHWGILLTVSCRLLWKRRNPQSIFNMKNGILCIVLKFLTLYLVPEETRRWNIISWVNEILYMTVGDFMCANDTVCSSVSESTLWRG